jgi:hypothetical protein
MSQGVNPTVSRVATASADDVVLLPAAVRHHFSVFNEAAAIMYLKFGPDASATDYTVQLPATTGFYESPPGLAYQGIVSARLASGTGNAQVTELD